MISGKHANVPVQVQHNEKKEAVDTCQSAFEISVLANKLLGIFCCTAQKLIW